MNRAHLEILNLFSRYLENEITLSEFQEKIAIAHWNIERTAPEMSKLVYQAVGKLAEFSRDHRTEESLRQDLSAALRPFSSLQALNEPASHRS